MDDRNLPALEYFELFLDFVAPVINVYFLYLLRRPFFHLNLRIMLANFSLSLIVITVLRIFLFLLPKITVFRVEHSFWVQVVHNGAMILIMNASIWMALERVFATVFAQKYENSRVWWISAALCVVMWLANVVFSFYIMNRARCAMELGEIAKDLAMKIGPQEDPKAHFPEAGAKFPDLYKCMKIEMTMSGSEVLGVLIAMIAINLSGVLIFVLVRLYNSRRWKADLARKLSHRYQIVENIRTSKQLLKALIADFIITCYFALVVHFVFDFNGQSNFTKFLGASFDLVAAISAILLPVLFITTHPKMRAVFKRHILCEHRRRLVQKVTQVVRQKPTVEAAKVETNTYFNQLQSSWK